MKEYLKNYIDFIDSKLEGDIKSSLIDSHLIKISFFQHERLVHLIVTGCYGILLVLSVFLCFIVPLFFIVVFILIVFLIFYVRHYFFLENGVQYLYKQYDMMVDKVKK